MDNPVDSSGGVRGIIAATPIHLGARGSGTGYRQRGPIGRDGPMAAAPLLHTPDEIEVRSGFPATGPVALTVILVIAPSPER